MACFVCATNFAVQPHLFLQIGFFQTFRQDKIKRMLHTTLSVRLVFGGLAILGLLVDGSRFCDL